jgi:hypothetical protein
MDGFIAGNRPDGKVTQVNEAGLDLEIVEGVCDCSGWALSVQPEGNDFVSRVVLRPESEEGK